MECGQAHKVCLYFLWYNCKRHHNSVFKWVAEVQYREVVENKSRFAWIGKMAEGNLVSDHLVEYCVSKMVGYDDFEAEVRAKADAGAKVGMRLDLIHAILQSEKDANISGQPSVSAEVTCGGEERLKDVAFRMHCLETIYKKPPIWIGLLLLSLPMDYVRTVVNLETLRAQNGDKHSLAEAVLIEEVAFQKILDDADELVEVYDNVDTDEEVAAAEAASSFESCHIADVRYERKLIRDWAQEFFTGTLTFHVAAVCNVKQDDVIFLCTNPMSVFSGTAAKCITKSLTDCGVELGEVFAIKHLGIGVVSVGTGVAAMNLSSNDVADYVKNAGIHGVLACLRKPEFVGNSMDIARSEGQLLFVTVTWCNSVEGVPTITCDNARKIDQLRLRTTEVVSLRKHFMAYPPIFEKIKELTALQKTGFDPDTVTNEIFDTHQKNTRRLVALKRRVFEYGPATVQRCEQLHAKYAELIAMAESARKEGFFDEKTAYKLVLIVQDTIPHPPLFYFVDMQLSTEESGMALCEVLKKRAAHISQQINAKDGTVLDFDLPTPAVVVVPPPPETIETVDTRDAEI